MIGSYSCIYVCLPSDKTSYLIRSSVQSYAENFFIHYLDKEPDPGKPLDYFLTFELPDDYRLVMEVIPRTQSFSPESEDENLWEGVPVGGLNLIKRLVGLVRDMPYSDHIAHYWSESRDTLRELRRYEPDEGDDL